MSAQLDSSEHLRTSRLDRFSVWFEDLAVKLFLLVVLGIGGLVFVKTAISIFLLF